MCELACVCSCLLIPLSCVAPPPLSFAAEETRGEWKRMEGERRTSDSRADRSLSHSPCNMCAVFSFRCLPIPILYLSPPFQQLEYANVFLLCVYGSDTLFFPCHPPSACLAGDLLPRVCWPSSPSAVRRISSLIQTP